MKMKKSMSDMLDIFKTDPRSRETRAIYEKKSKNWTREECKYFWECAMYVYPRDDYFNLAQRMIKCLCDNDLIEFDDIAYEFVELYKDWDGVDVGLATHTVEYISEQAETWLEDYATQEEDDMTQELEAELSDWDEDDREQAVDNLKFPTVEMLNEYRDAKRKCWYWDKLFEYCVFISGLVSKVAEQL